MNAHNRFCFCIPEYMLCFFLWRVHCKQHMYTAWLTLMCETVEWQIVLRCCFLHGFAFCLVQQNLTYSAIRCFCLHCCVLIQGSQCVFKTQSSFLDTFFYYQSFPMLAISNYSVRLLLYIMYKIVHLCVSSTCFIA